MPKIFIYIIGFVFATTANYVIFSYVNYGQTLFGIWRLVGIGLSVLFFFQFIRNINLINKATDYLEKHKLQRKGNYFFAFIFGIIHIVIVLELSGLINASLLDETNIETQAVITTCEESYCNCEYNIGESLYRQKINNNEYGFEEGDKIGIIYYVKNPNIYKIKDANIL